jgi:prepilin peptidase CpaA
MEIAIACAVFPFCLAFAAISDFLTMTIPNWVSALLLAGFVLIAPIIDLGIEQFASHLAAAAVVFMICFCLFALNVMGGGDAKLLTTSAIWFGLDPSIVTFFLYISMFGGALTLGVLLLRRQINTVIAVGIPVPRHLLTEKKIPYGIAIALGGFSAYPSSPLMQVAFAHLS